ncbi:MAG: hypothetical protein J07HN4v3_00530 [Halonotius sp. J07HN4]|nr:MAG: hypothetical protein J07HN4v3_00530 [Halonotius sp. J07HN4]
MSSLSPTVDAKFLSILVANGIPIVGLLAFDMSAPALLAFYWLEFGVLVIWAIVRATFAGKRRERGEIYELCSGFIGIFAVPVVAAYRGGWAILRLILSSRFFDDTEEGLLIQRQRVG